MLRFYNTITPRMIADLGTTRSSASPPGHLSISVHNLLVPVAYYTRQSRDLVSRDSRAREL